MLDLFLVLSFCDVFLVQLRSPWLQAPLFTDSPKTPYEPIKYSKRSEPRRVNVCGWLIVWVGVVLRRIIVDCDPGESMFEGLLTVRFGVVPRRTVVGCD